VPSTEQRPPAPGRLARRRPGPAQWPRSRVFDVHAAPGKYLLWDCRGGQGARLFAGPILGMRGQPALHPGRTRPRPNTIPFEFWCSTNGVASATTEFPGAASGAHVWLGAGARPAPPCLDSLGPEPADEAFSGEPTLSRPRAAAGVASRNSS